MSHATGLPLRPLSATCDFDGCLYLLNSSIFSYHCEGTAKYNDKIMIRVMPNILEIVVVALEIVDEIIFKFMKFRRETQCEKL